MQNAVWSNIFGPPKEKKAMVELLQGLPAFEGLSIHELLQLDRMLHLRRYKAEEIVFEENMPGAAMYIVKEGEIVIVKKVGESQLMELARIGARSFFGELALLDDSPRSASAYASRETTLLALAAPDLEKLKERNPKLALRIIGNVARLVCKRLVRTNENCELLQKRINEMDGRPQRSRSPQEVFNGA
jgi:CRP/FNR family transcriptional regulator, cyclic AMP receptor protein